VVGVVAAVVVVGAAAGLLVAARWGGDSYSYSGPAAPPFSLSWGELNRVDAPAADLLRLESHDGGKLVQSLAVRPLEIEGLPAGEAEPLPWLGLASDRARGEIASERPGARIVLEGPTELAVDRGPRAYQLAFVAPAPEAVAGGGIWFGKRLLVPDPDRSGQGIEIEIAERTSRPAVIRKLARAPSGFFLNWPVQLLLEDAASVRTRDGLEKPLRSFQFE
jgi:hypothetical protein